MTSVNPFIRDARVAGRQSRAQRDRNDRRVFGASRHLAADKPRAVRERAPIEDIAGK